MKGAVKRKEARNRAHMRKTGGGPPPEPLEDWELKVFNKNYHLVPVKAMKLCSEKDDRPALAFSS